MVWTAGWMIAPQSGGDAINYDFVTTTTGIMEKRDNTNPEFEVPDRLADLITNKDFGKYAKKGEELVTCFLTDHDITGGNSGSPVFNGNGELIGTNFDRNWEGTMSDVMYNGDFCRNIVLDVRFTLWMVDKYAGAGYLLNEMKLVK